MDNEYINGQGLSPYKNMKFMARTVGKSGCGPIAVYNALNALGLKKDFDDIINYYSKHKLINLNGILGTNIFSMAACFKNNGCKCKIYLLPNIKIMERIIKRDKIGIILYRHEKGAHFVCVQYDKYNDKRFIVYNKSNYSPNEYNYDSLVQMSKNNKFFLPVFLITLK